MVTDRTRIIGDFYVIVTFNNSDCLHAIVTFTDFLIFIKI